MKIQAAKRLLAAPLDKKQEMEFQKDLESAIPLLKTAERNPLGKGYKLDKDQAAIVTNALSKLGWVKSKGYFLKDGLWPLPYTDLKDGGMILRSASDDGIDWSAVVRKMAQRVMPSGFQVTGRKAIYYKQISYAALNNLESKISMKIKQAGFKPTDSRGSATPDGSSVQKGTTYTDATGQWLLTKSVGMPHGKASISMSLEYIPSYSKE